MNEAIASYAGVCILLLVGIAGLVRRGRRARWLRVLSWTIAAAGIATLAWSAMACTLLPLIGVIARPATIPAWAACTLGMSTLVGRAVLIALPPCFLLLGWYALRFGDEPAGWSSVVRATLFLAIPHSLVLLYAYTFPAFNDFFGAVWKALPYAGIGYLAGVMGLIIPRLAIGKLGPGRLRNLDGIDPRTGAAWVRD